MKRKLPSVNLYVLLVCTMAAFMLLQADWITTGRLVSGAATLLLISVISEAGAIPIGLGTVRSSISFIPYLAAIILVGPAWSMAVGGITVFVSTALFYRKPFVKVVFNGAKEIVAVGAAAHVYLWLGGAASLEHFRPSIPAFMLAVLIFFPIDRGSTAIAIALSTRTKLREAWGRLGAGHQIFDLGASTLALLLAFLYIELDLWGPLLVVAPLLLVRHVYGLVMRFENVNRDLLELMVKSIEARDPYTSGHSVRVSRFARTMAEELGLSAKQIDEVATAALLHDIGKIYQEYAPILRKEGALDSQEVRLLQSHPLKGAELIGTVSSLRGEVQRAVKHHHEAFGGRGYPDKQAGQEIPLASRIIAVVDTFDAMTTTRPYRRALSREAAFAELQSMVGRQFDPKIVDLFCTNERVAEVIDEALRERAPIASKGPVTTTAQSVSTSQEAPVPQAPKRRWTTQTQKDSAAPVERQSWPEMPSN